MKNKISSLTHTLLLLALAFTACRKDTLNIHIPPHSSSKLTLVMPAGVALPVGQYTAVISLQKDNGSFVKENAELSLAATNSHWELSAGSLAAGDYQLTKLLVFDERKKVVYAVPQKGSEKASLVQSPLPQRLTVGANTTLAPSTLASVGSNEAPALFGYQSADFRVQPAGGLAVKLVASVQVGAILYDSLPAMVTVKWWNAQQEMQQKTFHLEAGANDVALAEDAVKYQFDMQKWGMTVQKTVDRQDLSAGSTVLLEAETNAKLLKATYDYYEVEGRYYPESKQLFHYDGQGRLMKIEYWQKKVQLPDLQYRFTDHFHYENGMLSTIDRIDASQKTTGTTTFMYNGKKLVNMHELTFGRNTYASVEYQAAGELELNYLYDNGAALNYTMTMTSGNKVADKAFSSNGSGESGRYGYDKQINPYAHLGWITMYLSNQSKNNMVEYQKSHSGAIPSALPYQFDYTYDVHGYPTELIRHFKGYQNNQHLYKTKTEFIY